MDNRFEEKIDQLDQRLDKFSETLFNKVDDVKNTIMKQNEKMHEGLSKRPTWNFINWALGLVFTLAIGSYVYTFAILQKIIK